MKKSIYIILLLVFVSSLWLQGQTYFEDFESYSVGIFFSQAVTKNQ
jgi:hypothetical protein